MYLVRKLQKQEEPLLLYNGGGCGTIFASLMVSIIASLDIFHPLALGMAAGVGSSSMMAAMTGTLSTFIRNMRNRWECWRERVIC